MGTLGGGSSVGSNNKKGICSNMLIVWQRDRKFRKEGKFIEGTVLPEAS